VANAMTFRMQSSWAVKIGSGPSLTFYVTFNDSYQRNDFVENIMNKFTVTVALLVASVTLSDTQAESVQKEMKHSECESGCEAAFNEAVDKCENENEDKGLGEKVIERLCGDEGKTVKENCVTDCVSE